ncbi:583_t:CDS:2, partial [Funneliformis mosseae]
GNTIAGGYCMQRYTKEEGLKLYYKGLDAISDMVKKKIEKKLTNYDPNNIDNLLEAL